jgi:DNA-binding PadR family transcriptional regulator
LDSKEDRRKKILLLIATKGPLNKYRVCEYLVPKHGSEPTILYSIKDLEQDGQLGVAKTDRNARGPAGRSDYYDLTVRGLANLITLLEKEELDRTIDHLATKYAPLLPGIFDVWPTIKQVGVQDIAQRQLRRRCENLFELSNPKLMTGLSIRGKHTDIATLTQSMVHDFWETGTIHDVEVERKWLQGLSKNDTLRQTVIRETIRRANEEVSARNWILQQLSHPELKVKRSDEIEAMQQKTVTQHAEIEELRQAVETLSFHVRMLSDASGLRITTTRRNK